MTRLEFQLHALAAQKTRARSVLQNRPTPGHFGFSCCRNALLPYYRYGGGGRILPFGRSKRIQYNGLDARIDRQYERGRNCSEAGPTEPLCKTSGGGSAATRSLEWKGQLFET
jgi:hypothetical protein